ncbi:hypothetical protein [Streptomyces geysiriensis]|uniref:hypothetical protein n=1 Tax=Streptomyces geysiriensis TaxID=68207 RepID=UPI001C7DE7EB|nr:hypothetical protein [Streptomyces geysiriensis]MBX4177028.1 hypothetical protein [Streptomyces geysiriensis]
MNVTLDFGTVVVATVGIVIGFWIYQATAPVPLAMPTVGMPVTTGMTKGERLVAALTATVAVITIGSYLMHGVKTVEVPRGVPAPVSTVSPTSYGQERAEHR